MSVNFSGFQSYYPDPCKSGYVVDQSQLIRLPNQSMNPSAKPTQTSGGISRPSFDTYEPSGKFQLPDSFTFTVPGRIGYIDFSQDDLVWKDITEHVGESFTVPFNPPEKPKFDPYDYYTDDPYSIKIIEKNPNGELGERELHAFLHQTGDTLANAAQHLVAKGAITSERCEQDLEKFAKDTLDFFMDGKYTESDVKGLKDELHQVVRQLADQLKSGEKLDIHKVDTKLTIGGVETTATELFRFQKVGRIFEEKCGLYCGSLISSDYGETGVAYAAAKKMAASHGELGKMFGNKIDRLFENYRADFLKKTTEIVENELGEHTYGKYHDSLRAGQEILDVYAGIDFGDPTSMEQAHKKAAAIVQKHCERFGLSFKNYAIQNDQKNIEEYAAWVNSQIFE